MSLSDLLLMQAMDYEKLVDRVSLSDSLLMQAMDYEKLVNCVSLSDSLLMQAMDYARKLRDDRGRGNIVVVDDGKETEEQMGDHEFQVTTLCFTLSSLCFLAVTNTS